MPRIKKSSKAIRGTKKDRPQRNNTNDGFTPSEHLRGRTVFIISQSRYGLCLGRDKGGTWFISPDDAMDDVVPVTDESDLAIELRGGVWECKAFETREAAIEARDRMEKAMREWKGLDDQIRRYQRR